MLIQFWGLRACRAELKPLSAKSRAAPSVFESKTLAAYASLHNLFGGSWDFVSRVISKVTIVITT